MRKLESDKVDKQYLHSEEFYSVLEFVWTQVAQTRDENKIRYLRAFFLRAMAPSGPDVTLRELLERYLISMAGAHLRVLEMIFDKQKRYSSADRAHFLTAVDGELPLDVAALARLLPGFSQELVRTLCVDLITYGLVGDWALTHDGEAVQSKFYLTENGEVFMRELSHGL